MKSNNKVLIYIECVNAIVMSKLAKDRIKETTRLQYLTDLVLVNLDKQKLLKYIKDNHIKTVYVIAPNQNIFNELNNWKTLEVIYIDLQNFINKPQNY